MPSKKLPHEDHVLEIKELVAKASQAASHRWDDGTDQCYARGADGSSMERSTGSFAQYTGRAEALACDLLDLGPVAAEAVAKGLRTQGRWRELLIGYAREHRHSEPIRRTLELLAKRKVDPLATVAGALLSGAASGPPPICR